MVVRVVIHAVLTWGLAETLAAQEEQLEIVEFTVGCREEPAPGAGISLKVLTAWVEENALFADIAVANQSSSEIYLPGRNTGGHYWDAVLYDRKGEPITYCGGVSELNPDPFAELVAESDVVSVEAGETIVLPRIALAPFWPYLRESGYDARSFEVFYTGWSNIVVQIDRAASNKLRPALESASKRHCKLYGSELRGRGRLPDGR